MSDYGLQEIARDSAIEEARLVAARLRKLADRVEALADDAEASTDDQGKVATLGQRVLDDVLGSVSGFGLGDIVQHSTTWARENGCREASKS